MLARSLLRAACSTGGAGSSSVEAIAQRLLPAASSRCTWLRHYSSESGEEKREISDPTVLALADQIITLNLLQVADLTEILKQRLGIQAPMMGMPMHMMGGGMPAAGGGAAAEAPAEAAPVEEKTEFSLKLEGYEAASKIKVIKEVRAMTGLGLKEAKELVSTCCAAWGCGCVVAASHSLLRCERAGQAGQIQHFEGPRSIQTYACLDTGAT